MDAPPDPPTTSATQESRIYGPVPGVSIGDDFPSRKALMDVGLHGQIRAGIHGDPSPNGGAFSICISGGYEDDKDDGDKITYVGSGGQDPSSESRKQIADQSFDDPGNKSLYISCQTKRPVRVIRGENDSSHYAPTSGYRYDGLYVVDSATMKRGKRGFNMCFFKLRRIKEAVNDRSPPYRRLLTKGRMAKMLRGIQWR